MDEESIRNYLQPFDGRVSAEQFERITAACLKAPVHAGQIATLMLDATAYERTEFALDALNGILANRADAATTIEKKILALSLSIVPGRDNRSAA